MFFLYENANKGKSKILAIRHLFHCPCSMSTYLVSKSRVEHVHYNRDFEEWTSEWTRCENESCKTTLKLAISTIHHFILLKLEIPCLLYSVLSVVTSTIDASSKATSH